MQRKILQIMSNEVGGQHKNIRNQDWITLDTFSIMPIQIKLFHLTLNFFLATNNLRNWPHYNIRNTRFIEPHVLLNYSIECMLLKPTSIITKQVIYLTLKLLIVLKYFYQIHYRLQIVKLWCSLFPNKHFMRDTGPTQD